MVNEDLDEMGSWMAARAITSGRSMTEREDRAGVPMLRPGWMASIVGPRGAAIGRGPSYTASRTKATACRKSSASVVSSAIFLQYS